MDDYPSYAQTLSVSDTLNEREVAGIVPGTLIGRYVVVDHLGAGGMGSVYAAYDAQLDRRVAIKVLRPDTRAVEDGRARLLREAQAMARLTHPNVLAVHDVGLFGEDVFIAMDYVEGRTLKSWMRDPHAWREALRVLTAAGRGLAAAHAAGLVHRDFKPENVLLGNDGRVVVADFGIARAQGAEEPAPADAPPYSGRALDRAASPPVEATTGPISAPRSSRSPSALATPLTETGALIGTVGYMAPERAFDSRDDARSDQFSFAVTLYRVLYGAPPFDNTSVSAYLTALLSRPAAPPEGTRVPAWVHAVIARGLERDPAARFTSMDDLLAALERDPTRRRRNWAIAAVVAGLLGVAGLARAREQRVVREECAIGEKLMAQTWNPATRAAVGAALEATNAPLVAETAKRAQRVLDDWSKAWVSAHREASEATRLRGVESTATMETRLRCLERERDEMSALVDRLSHADRGIAHRALTAAYQLPQPSMCWEPNAARAGRLPDAPGPRERAVALQRRIADASALRITGGCKGVIPAAAAGLEEARAIGDRHAEAEFLVLRSTCERQQGDADACTATRQEAFAAAIASGDDSLAAVTAAKIAFELADNLAKPREARRWLAIGQGVLQREGRDDRAEVELLESEIQILSGEGYPERTLELHDRAIALLTKVYGPEHPAVAAAINNKANDLNSVGRHEESIAELRRSAGIDEALFGADNPMLHIDYNNIGVGYTMLGRYDDARAALEHSLVLVKPLGESSANAIVPWASMAVVENRAGRPDAALKDLDRALAIADATGDNGARYRPCLYEEQGTALLAKGDARGALDACGRALKLQEELEAIGPDKLYTDDALTCLGEAELALGRKEEAIAHLERGVTLVKRDSGAALPLAQFALAKALRAAGRDPERVRALAESAAKGLERAPDGAGRGAAVAAWVAEK